MSYKNRCFCYICFFVLFFFTITNSQTASPSNSPAKIDTPIPTFSSINPDDKDDGSQTKPASTDIRKGVETKPPVFSSLDSSFSISPAESHTKNIMAAPPSRPPYLANLRTQEKEQQHEALMGKIEQTVSDVVGKHVEKIQATASSTDNDKKTPVTTKKEPVDTKTVKLVAQKNKTPDALPPIDTHVNAAILDAISDSFEAAEFKKKISLHVKPSPVHEVIAMIGKLSNIDFVVDPDVTGNTGRISCTRCSISDLLRYICSTNQPRLAMIKYFNSWQIMRFEKAVRLIQLRQQQDFSFQTIPVYNAKFDENLQYRIKEIWGKIITTLGPEEKKRSFLTFDTLNRKIFIYSLRNYVRDLERFIHEIDRVVPQVRVDIVIVTARKSYVYNFGFNWSGVYNRQSSLKASHSRLGLAGIGASVTEYPTPDSGFSQSTGQPLNNTNLLIDPLNFALNLFTDKAQSLVKIPFVFGGSDLNLRRLNLILNAAEAEQKLKILARPSVLTNNGETAEMLVGESLPLQTTVEDLVEGKLRSTQDIRFKDIGTHIKIRPVVNQERKTISLDIWISDSEVTGSLSRQINTSGTLTKDTPPVIATLYTTNKVMLKSGQTTVIGGLVRNSIEKNKSVMPFLHRIPIIGWFFRAANNEQLDEEQLIFVTPTLIEPLI